MSTSFDIRLEAIFDHYEQDNDILRLQRECSQLDLDLIGSIRRYESCSDKCEELHELLDYLHVRIGRLLNKEAA